MWHPILLNAFQKHLTQSEITLLYNSHTQGNPIHLSQLHIASPQFYHYCCTIFNTELDSIFIHCITHMDWATFTLLYTQQQPRNNDKFNMDLAESLIQAHLPIQFLNYHCQQQQLLDVYLCRYAAQYNNIAALKTLRDPNTGAGRCPWSEWTCSCAAMYGYLETLIWLRNPNTGGGACPWRKDSVCSYAAEHGHLHILRWLRNPNTDTGICDWDLQQCLGRARGNHHFHIVAWISAQHNNDNS